MPARDSAGGGAHEARRPLHDPRPRRRPGGRRDPLPVGASHPRDGLPHRRAQPRRRLSSTDRPFDSGLGGTMLRGLWKLTWLEIKIFIREPLGLVGTIGVPVVMFVVLGRLLGRRAAAAGPRAGAFAGADVPGFASILITLSAVLS